MDPLFFWLLLIVVLVAGIFLARELFSAREMTRELRRMARGDYRPVILRGSSSFWREANADLRVVAEALSSQQAQLAEEEFSLSLILERMSEGVLIAGTDLRIRLLNKAVSEMFGISGQAKGLLLQEVCLSHELQDAARQSLATGEVHRREFTLAVPGRRERRHLLVTTAPLQAVEAGSPGGLLLVLHDVTRMRELESIRREFVANVSHEFRTPLAIINGYLETLEDEKLDRKMFRKAITVMRRHGERLNDLIEDLLTISRMEEKAGRLETEPADVSRILERVAEQMEREVLARNALLKLDLPENLPLVEVDDCRIDQVFSNLLANALRHGCVHGGEVSIRAENRGSEVMIGFRDNGPGIPFQDQEHVFERFYRVGGDRARQSGGTGLGLSIVKNVVQAHGGRIVLESKPGAGADFMVFLPVAVRQGIS